MSREISVELRDGLDSMASYQDWVASVEVLEGLLSDHPTQGAAEGFDRYDQNHLDAQSRLNPAIQEQSQRRRKLDSAIRDTSEDNLDVIAKIAVLSSLHRFTPTRFFKQQPKKIFDPSTGARVMSLQSSGPRKLDNIDQVLTSASRLDQALRAVDEALNDGRNEIEVIEDYTISGYSFTLKEKLERGTTITTGTVDDRSTSFPLEHPTPFHYSIPNYLRDVVVIGRRGGAENGRRRGDLPSALMKTTENNVETVSIPLNAVHLAMGYSEPIRGGDIRRSADLVTRVSINGQSI